MSGNSGALTSPNKGTLSPPRQFKQEIVSESNRPGSMVEKADDKLSNHRKSEQGSSQKGSNSHKASSGKRFVPQAMDNDVNFDSPSTDASADNDAL